VLRATVVEMEGRVTIHLVGCNPHSRLTRGDLHLAAEKILARYGIAPQFW
jgi:hypothetical protein